SRSQQQPNAFPETTARTRCRLPAQPRRPEPAPPRASGRTPVDGPGKRGRVVPLSSVVAPARPTGALPKATAQRRRRSVIVRSVLKVAGSPDSEIPAIGTLNQGALH